MSTHGGIVIEISSLSFGYEPGTEELYDVSLNVKQGDFMALLGPNGGGKTTLIKLMLGLLKPDSGNIKVFGEKPASVRSRIGYVPQSHPSEESFPISAEDVALMGRLKGHFPCGRYSKADKTAALESLEVMNVAHLASKGMNTLSGGQKQRVLIARALTGSPDILLLDEPSAGIDSKNQQNFYNLLEKLTDRMTIVLVTHDIGAVSGHVKSIACLNGTLFEHADKLTATALQKTYGCPFELVTHGTPHRVLEDGHCQPKDETND